MFNQENLISVYNYNRFALFAKSKDGDYMFPAADADGTPSMVLLSPTEVLGINGVCDIFKSGALRFDLEKEAEIYKALRIVEWKKILKNDDIIAILNAPTAEGLQSLIDIQSVAVFERVYSLLIWLKNTKQSDVSTRVSEMIEARYAEIRSGHLNSRIIVREKAAPVGVSTEEADIIRTENATLRSQMEQMMAELQALKTQITADVSATKEAPAPEVELAAKKASQPKPSSTTASTAKPRVQKTTAKK